ncbi:hypothetical protein ACU686_10355 [Yinghuangia aomiensis]
MPVTVEDLVGYVERDLDGDLARWFADAPRVAVPEETRPVGAFLAKLPAEAAAALEAFDRRVRSGEMARFLELEEWTYGFDFAANECEVLDSDYETPIPDEDLWAIGGDGGGNLFVVLTTGRVAVWFHEEQVIEAHTDYDSIDAFVWSLVRYQAVRDGALDLPSVEAEFRELGQPGALAPEVGLLAYLA